MRTPFIRFICCMALATLAACGGGGSDAGDTSPLAVFLGSWSEPCVAEGADSGTLDLNFNTISNGTLSGQATIKVYVGNTTCTGTPTTSLTEALSVSYDGIKIVSGDSAVKVTITAAGTAEKDLLLIKGGKLLLGVESPVDADGYPEAIDFSRPLNKN